LTPAFHFAKPIFFWEKSLIPPAYFAKKCHGQTTCENSVKISPKKFVGTPKVALKLQQVVFVFICLG
jgi:hypothetical protein